ncbi:ABC transporter substrate-binding protein [Halobacteriales archaeon QS_1_68_20]|nr:MAG: ABC transporter substrate-binding protein [Halobacteriales archaeon QS_1_68_20]
MMKAVGGSAIAAALAGCTRLLGDDGDDGGGSADVPDEPIQAGLQTFTEGAASVLGLQTQYGAELAIQRINDAGGVAGREIELDVRHEAEAHVENYQQFVDEGKDVTFGPTSSGGHEALTQEVEEQGVVNVGTDGTVTTLYEETNDDPLYSFRFQNYDVMECVTVARAVVEELGADNVDTVAGINPNYSFGQDEMRFFVKALKQMTDAEVVYEGYPDLLAEDMSTHITEVNNESPDVTFSSMWGGDVTTLLTQAQANDMFDETQIAGTVLYSAVDDLGRDVIEDAEAISGSRNWYWGHPDPGRWSPGRDLFEVARDQFDVVPTAHFHSGYGAVAAWATAVEKAVDLIGGWPSQDQIARALEGHGFYTPSGYHVIRADDHQGMSNSYYGRMTWDDDVGAAALTDVGSFGPREVAPPPGTSASDWIDSW